MTKIQKQGAAGIEVPAIIDVEASGFGRGSYPIEVGFILPDLTSFCCLIKPEPNWIHWDPDAEKIHGIKRETLLEKGKPAAEVAEILNQYLRNRTVYTDGWGNDHSWLARLYDETGKAQKYRLETLVSLLTEEQMDIWKANKLAVTEELSMNRHRASADARILQMTYIRTWMGTH